MAHEDGEVEVGWTLRLGSEVEAVRPAEVGRLSGAVVRQPRLWVSSQNAWKVACPLYEDYDGPMSNYDIHSMICPKCSFEQPEAPECANCGIIIEKWEAQKSQAEQAAPGGAWGGGGGVDHRTMAASQQQAAVAGSWAEQIQARRLGTRPATEESLLSGFGVGALRFLSGAAAVGAATWLSVSINPLDNYTAMAIIAVAGALFVWVALSVRAPVSARQVGFEAILAIVCVAGVVVTMPGLLDGGQPAQPGKTAKKTPPKANPNAALETPLGQFAVSAQTYIMAVGSLLDMDGPASHAEWDGLTPRLDFAALTRKFQGLGQGDRGEALVAWERTQKVGGVVTDLLQRFKEPATDGSGFTFRLAPEKLSQAKALHVAAQTAMEQLFADLKVIR